MKKGLCFALALGLALLCGCMEKNAGITPVTKGISFSAAVVYYNECYNCKVTVDADGVMTARMTKPEDIKGLTVRCGKEGVSAQFKGLSYDFKSGTLPIGGICGAVYDALDDTFAPDTEVFCENDKYFVKGRTKTDPYTMYFGETGLPISLEIPDKSFVVTFKNVTILKD